MPFTIIAESCTGCSACEKRCPTGAISGISKKVYFIEPGMCIDCGACGVICPDDAILDNKNVLTHVLKRAERPVAVVHPDNCNGCGVCIDVCPFDCISPSPENNAVYWARPRQREDLRGLLALRRGLRMGQEYTSCRPARRGVPQLSRLFNLCRRCCLTSVSFDRDR